MTTDGRPGVGTIPTPNHPWDRLDGESSKAYEAFLFYRDMGPGRTVRDAYRQFTGKPTATQAGGGFLKWGKDFRWDERARAWDDHNRQARDRAALAATSANVFDLARERQKAVRAGIAFGSLCRRRARDLLELATAPSVPGVTRAAPDVRTLAVAATLGKVGCEVIWRSLDEAAAVEAGTPAGGPLTLSETQRAIEQADALWLAWEAEKRAALPSPEPPKLMTEADDASQEAVS